MSNRYRHYHSPAGFTLLEVMLVILLIGLLATMVVVNFADDSRDKKLAQEAERFQQLFQFAAEMALLKQQEWGLHVQENQYQFLVYQQNTWQPVTEPASLQQYTLPATMRLQLQLDGLTAEDNLLSQLQWPEDDDRYQQEKVVLPQVFILSSGEISPFRLIFSEHSDIVVLYAAVETDFSIPLQRSAVTEQQP